MQTHQSSLPVICATITDGELNALYAELITKPMKDFPAISWITLQQIVEMGLESLGESS